MTGTTNFYLPPGATTHGLIVRQLATVKDNVLTEELVYVHYSCKSTVGAATSPLLDAFVCPARLNITPPGLPSGGQSLQYVWQLRGAGAGVCEVEVWLCGAMCRRCKFIEAHSHHSPFIQFELL
jgi:hypothetical protein